MSKQRPLRDPFENRQRPIERPDETKNFEEIKVTVVDQQPAGLDDQPAPGGDGEAVAQVETAIPALTGQDVGLVMDAASPKLAAMADKSSPKLDESVMSAPTENLQECTISKSTDAGAPEVEATAIIHDLHIPTDVHAAQIVEQPTPDAVTLNYTQIEFAAAEHEDTIGRRDDRSCPRAPQRRARSG